MMMNIYFVNVLKLKHENITHPLYSFTQQNNPNSKNSTNTVQKYIIIDFV